VQAAQESDAAEWDQFAGRQAGFTHFHRYGWRRVISRQFRHPCDYLLARDPSGALRGVLPLVRVRSLLFGDYMVSLPFLNYGGPLGDVGAQEALVQHAVALARDRKIDLLELRCREARPLQMQLSTRKITVVLDLPASGADQLFRNLDSKVRSQVRRPIKDGVVTKFGPDHLPDFHRVFSHHMRDLGTPALPLSFFRLMSEEFGESMWVGVAYLNGAPIAGGCGFTWGTEFEMTWASSLRSHAKVAANMLLYWAFIERSAQHGMTVFNFGRCTPGGGTHRFKSQWNSRDEQLWWYQYSPSGRTSTPSPDGKYSMGPRLWRHLPVWVATRLGPVIVRNIP
jgi:FemAB-related protein (PEP-CTERM system-associated)